MALLPRAVRPSALMRRWAMGQGVRSDSELYRFLAMLLIGRMAFVRRSAMRRGVFGGNPAWQTIAVAFFVNDMRKKFLVKQSDLLSTEVLEAGQTVTITSLPPAARRRKRSS